MEEQTKEVNSSVVDENQSTGSENNTPVENKAPESPATDSTALTNNVQEVSVASNVTNQINPISEELPVRNIPLNHQTDGGIEMPYLDAAKFDFINENVVFETVDSAGRGSGSRFVANTDLTRAVKTYQPKNGTFIILPIGRNSDKASEGGLIGSTMVELGFSGFRFYGTKHRDQATLVLVNGKHLVGYVLKGESKGSRRALYFPKTEAEKAIALPAKGKVLKLQVAKLLIG